jgi:hypothetical protein
MPAPSFTQNDTSNVHGVTWDGYKVSMYRSPDSGDMVFDIETPEDFGDKIDIFVNDMGVDLP